MATPVVGYFPPQLLRGVLPIVPDYLLVSDGEKRLIENREGRRDEVPAHFLKTWTEIGKLVERDVGERPEGMWPCVREASVEWFHVRDEQMWRSSEARRLLEESQGAPDPMRVLSLCEAAAAMAGQDLGSLVERLRSEQAPGESLSDTYTRTGKTEK